MTEQPITCKTNKITHDIGQEGCVKCLYNRLYLKQGECVANYSDLYYSIAALKINRVLGPIIIGAPKIALVII